MQLAKLYYLKNINPFLFHSIISLVSFSLNKSLYSVQGMFYN